MTVQLNCVDLPLSMFSRAGVSFMDSGTEVRAGEKRRMRNLLTRGWRFAGCGSLSVGD